MCVDVGNCMKDIHIILMVYREVYITSTSNENNADFPPDFPTSAWVEALCCSMFHVFILYFFLHNSPYFHLKKTPLVLYLIDS